MDQEQRYGMAFHPDRRTFLRAITTTGLVGLAGCTGEPGDEQSGPEDEQSGGARNLIWATNVANETYEALSRELRAILEGRANYDVETNDIGENPNVEIARGFGNGDFDFGLIRSDVAYFAANGTGLEEFEDDPVEAIRGVATLYPEAVHVLTRSDAGIESLKDLEGETIETGAPGSPKRVTALRILESVGISGDDFTERNDGVGGAARTATDVPGDDAGLSVGFAQMDGGSLDEDVEAAFVIGGWPAEVVENLLETGEFELLGLDEDARNEILEDVNWFTESTIPARTYDELEGDVETVSVQAMIATRQGVDGGTVGGVTTTIFEHTEQIETKGEFISSETAMEGMSIEMDSAAEESLEDIDEQNGDPSDGDPSDGDPSDDNTSDGEPSDDNTSDSEPSDSEPSDGEPSNGEPPAGGTTDNNTDTGTETTENGGDGGDNGDGGSPDGAGNANESEDV